VACTKAAGADQGSQALRFSESKSGRGGKEAMRIPGSWYVKDFGAQKTTRGGGESRVTGLIHLSHNAYTS